MKYSRQIVEEIAKLVEEGNFKKDAAALAGISEDTFYSWMKKPEFAERLKRAMLKAKRRMIMVIQRAALGDPNKKVPGIWTAAAWYLERVHHDEFGQRMKSEQSGPGGGPIITKQMNVPELPPEMMRKLASMSIPETNGNHDTSPPTDTVGETRS